MKYSESEVLEIALSEFDLEDGKCPAPRWLDAAAGGELPVALVEPMQAHLDSCAECRELLERVKEARRMEAEWEQSPSDAASIAGDNRTPGVAADAKFERSVQTSDPIAIRALEGDCLTASQSMSGTRWTIIASAQTSGPDRSRALDELCRMYWYPVYCYLRRADHGADEASAILQGFFANFFASDIFARATKDRGRFRVVLFDSLESFLKTTRKDSPIQSVIPFNPRQAEPSYLMELSDSPSPKAAFDHGWAITIVRHARSAVETTWRSQAEPLYNAISDCLKSGNSTDDQERIAKQFNLTVTDVADHIRRLKSEKQEAIRREISDTVAPSEFEAELNELIELFKRVA